MKKTKCKHQWIYYPNNPPPESAESPAAYTTRHETVGRTCTLCQKRENWHAVQRLFIPVKKPAPSLTPQRGEG